MNRRKIILILVPVLAISAAMLFAFRQKVDPIAKNKVLSELLYSGLSQAHFNMKDVDDDFSKNAFDLYLKAIDNTKRFLLKSDIEQLEQYSDKMDDEFKAGKSQMLNATIAVLEKRIPEAKTIVMDLLDKPFDFTVDEQYQIDPEKRDFPKDESELKESWIKLLKYKALIRYQTAIKT
jgi:carboxyl-terminal processing protease